MDFKDLRGWLSEVEKLGQLKHINGAHWRLEIGGISEANYQRKGYPALLFENIPDHPAGGRVLTGANGTSERLAITLRLPDKPGDRELVKVLAGKPNQWEKESSSFSPVEVKSGEINENVMMGEKVSLRVLPAPLWHEKDGGRYIQTGGAVITRDPETGIHNLGAYRCMVHDDHSLTVNIDRGHHGQIHYEKWFAREGKAPIAICLGHDPLLTVLAALEVPWGVSEYNYAGAIIGKPVEVIKSEHTGLFIPAHAEAVLEGWIYPGVEAPEGPFGEWTGYYSQEVLPVPLLKVDCLRYRANPIVIGSPPGKPPHDYSFFRTVLKSAMIFDALVKAGLVEIKGVWAHEAGSGRLWVVVAIKQRYFGHSRQVGFVTAHLQAAAYMLRYVIVVDDDIDPSNLEQVVWAMCTRSDPATDIEVMKKCWGAKGDPVSANPELLYNSRAFIDACRPFERIHTFPPVAASSPEYLEEIRKKWKDVFNH
jgi:UbiD family decarboxylase